MRVRLSKLQRRIIAEVANHTVNINSDLYTHRRRGRTEWVPYREIFYACGPHWGGKITKAAKASYSRSLHDLVRKKNLLCALSLGWFIVSGPHEDFMCWQGAGKYKDMEEWGNLTSPRLRLLSLTEEGWKVFKKISVKRGRGRPRKEPD